MPPAARACHPTGTLSSASSRSPSGRSIKCRKPRKPVADRHQDNVPQSFAHVLLAAMDAARKGEWLPARTDWSIPNVIVCMDDSSFLTRDLRVSASHGTDRWSSAPFIPTVLITQCIQVGTSRLQTIEYASFGAPAAALQALAVRGPIVPVGHISRNCQPTELYRVAAVGKGCRICRPERADRAWPGFCK